MADDTRLDHDPALPGPSPLCRLALERIGDFLAAPDPGTASLARRTTAAAPTPQLRRSERPAIGLCCSAQDLVHKTLGARPRAASAIADPAGSNAKVGGIIAHGRTVSPHPADLKRQRERGAQ